MQTGRDRGLNKPEALSEHQARRREWDQSADIIRASGHRSRARRPICSSVACRHLSGLFDPDGIRDTAPKTFDALFERYVRRTLPCLGWTTDLPSNFLHLRRLNPLSFVASSDYGMVAKARAGLYRFPCIMIAQAMRASLLA